MNVTEFVGRIASTEPMVVELSESETQKHRTSCGKLFITVTSGVLAIGDLVPDLASSAALQRRTLHVSELATSPHAADAAAAAAASTAASATTDGASASEAASGLAVTAPPPTGDLAAL